MISRLQEFAWIPVVAFIVIAGALYWYDNGVLYQSQALLTTLNVLFNCSVSLLIVYLAARSYRVTGSRAVLLLGCGTLIFAAINLLSGVMVTDTNDTLTVYNTGICLAGLCFVGSAISGIIQKPAQAAPTSASQHLYFYYLAILIGIGLLALGAMADITPAFYVPEQGFTLLRQAFMMVTVVEFIAAAACFGYLYRQSGTPFLLLYSFGLLMIGTGVGILTICGDIWTLLGWAGRGGQYLGALYMLVAIASLARGHDERIPLKRALQVSEEKFRNMVETATEGIWICDFDGRAMFINKRMAEMIGYDPEEIMGKPIYNFMGDEAAALAKLNLERRKQGLKDRYDQKLVRKDGTILWAVVSASPITDESGRITASMVMLTDITERKQAEMERERLLKQLKAKTAELEDVNEELEVKNEELAAQTEEIECANEELRTNNEELQRVTESMREAQEYLESLINSANAPIIVWDSKFTITRFNRAFEWFSGYTAKEVLGRDLSILFPLGNRDESLQKIKNTLEGEQWDSVEIPIRHKSGNTRIALWNSANVYGSDRSLLATIAQGQDITARKQMEKALEDEKAQAELYLDLMGHDISNLHQIALMQLELAESIMSTRGKLEAEDKEIIDTSLKTLERAARLIDNVRKLQKLKLGEYSLELVDMSKLLEDVLKEYASIPGRDVTIRYAPNCECLVRANPLLKDVFSNLLDNSIKHSSNPLEIGVEVQKLGQNCSSYYRVAIEDNGNGIADEKKDEVFRRFRRGQTNAKGTGLGLYLVKSLVESFGGRVEVQNRVLGDYRKGTRFIVYLPAGVREDIR